MTKSLAGWRAMAGRLMLAILYACHVPPQASAQAQSPIAPIQLQDRGLSGQIQSLPILAQIQNQPRGSTVLPTDVVPLPLSEERQTLGESFKLRLWQKLPTRFYMSATCETSFRIETNVFQFPTKAEVINNITRGRPFADLSQEEQDAALSLASKSSKFDNVYRITPNVTAGWALGAHTRVFANYFLLRDKLFKNNVLNTTINQLGAGIEHDIPIGQKASLELQMMARELWQSETDPVFDYLPSATLSYFVRPNMVAYVNALLQMRSTHFMQGPNRELDPFYTFGLVYQRGLWALSANATFLQNFRDYFSQASIKQNSYTWILDFEIARQLFKRVPGLQAFLRAEPVYNFHSNDTPGLSGMDFRFYYGLRGNVSKPPLLATVQMLKQRYRQQEPKKQKEKKKPVTKPGGTKPGEEKKPGGDEQNAPTAPGQPSATLPPVPAQGESTPQPMHGFVLPCGRESCAPDTFVSSN